MTIELTFEKFAQWIPRGETDCERGDLGIKSLYAAAPRDPPPLCPPPTPLLVGRKSGEF